MVFFTTNIWLRNAGRTWSFSLPEQCDHFIVQSKGWESFRHSNSDTKYIEYDITKEKTDFCIYFSDIERNPDMFSSSYMSGCTEVLSEIYGHPLEDTDPTTLPDSNFNFDIMILLVQ